MAIFNKSDKQTDYSSNITTIAAGSNVTGKIEIECELHIDGNLQGDITSNGTVKVGKSGVVVSNLTAKKLIVTGKFSGNAECEVIELISGGEATGKLVSSSLVIDNKSRFEGESILKTPGETHKLTDKISDENMPDRVIDKIVDIGNEPDPFKGNKKAELGSPKKL